MSYAIFITKAHTTENEMEHIKGLSLNGFKKGSNNYNPREALDNYIRASAKRVRWDNIDKANVLQYANALLAGLG